MRAKASAPLASGWPCEKVPAEDEDPYRLASSLASFASRASFCFLSARRFSSSLCLFSLNIHSASSSLRSQVSFPSSSKSLIQVQERASELQPSFGDLVCIVLVHTQ